MATRYRTLSRPAFFLFKSTISQPSIRNKRPTSPSYSVFGVPMCSSPTTTPSKAVTANGLSSISIATPHSSVLSSAHLMRWFGLQGLQVVVSGYALQCQSRSLILSTNNVSFRVWHGGVWKRKIQEINIQENKT